MYYRDYSVKKFAKGGTIVKKGGKFGINDMVMVDDSSYIKLFTGFDTTKPAKIIDVNKVKTSRGTFYTYGLEFEGGEKPFNYAMENKLSLVQGVKMADGGMMANGGKMAKGGIMAKGKEIKTFYGSPNWIIVPYEQSLIDKLEHAKKYNPKKIKYYEDSLEVWRSAPQNK
jgi:hypothetical protein